MRISRKEIVLHSKKKSLVPGLNIPLSKIAYVFERQYNTTMSYLCSGLNAGNQMKNSVCSTMRMGCRVWVVGYLCGYITRNCDNTHINMII